MKEPPSYQQAFMHSIEMTVLRIREEFPKLLDEDVAYAFEQLTKLLPTTGQGKGSRRALVHIGKAAGTHRRNTQHY